jgi:cysteinyl-tRNA synthetase
MALDHLKSLFLYRESAMLKIYNSLTQQKEIFKPIKAGEVSLYVCGMTVYDHCHLGHARSLIAFDNVVRYLRLSGYRVRYVRNITDIDDKIIKRAQENHEDFCALTDRFITALHEDTQKLGLLSPDEEPRATQHIEGMISLIKALCDKRYAYVSETGDVYFDVRQFKSYGKLSHRKLDELESGARGNVSDAKRDPLDFALWKSAKPEEPSWASPWGQGRPGWHVECSAMAMACLDKHIDIHGGGKDLIFPHHENEIAQTESFTGEPLANIWMHAGHLQINDTKMSKSLKNYLTIRDVLMQYEPEVVRYFVASSHYRSPLNYTDDSLSSAKEGLTKLYLAMRGVRASMVSSAETQAMEKSFKEVMDDDFNTPQALSVLFDIAKKINKLKETNVAKASSLAGLLQKLGSVLGILQLEPESFLKGEKTSLSNPEIDSLIKERNLARSQKNWKRADEIRDQLLQLQVVLEDTTQGTTYRVEK